MQLKSAKIRSKRADFRLNGLFGVEETHRNKNWNPLRCWSCQFWQFSVTFLGWKKCFLSSWGKNDRKTSFQPTFVGQSKLPDMLKFSLINMWYFEIIWLRVERDHSLIHNNDMFDLSSIIKKSHVHLNKGFDYARARSCFNGV